jgi:hypothetical protein
VGRSDWWTSADWAWNAQLFPKHQFLPSNIDKTLEKWYLEGMNRSFQSTSSNSVSFQTFTIWMAASAASVYTAYALAPSSDEMWVVCALLGIVAVLTGVYLATLEIVGAVREGADVPAAAHRNALIAASLTAFSIVLAAGAVVIGSPAAAVASIGAILMATEKGHEVGLRREWVVVVLAEAAVLMAANALADGVISAYMAFAAPAVMVATGYLGRQRAQRSKPA